MAGEKNPNEHQGNDTFILLAYLLRDISFVLFLNLTSYVFFSSFLKQKRKSSLMAIVIYKFEIFK